MDNTQNDLSADTVKLDYSALEQTAAIAYSSQKRDINRYLDLLTNNDFAHDNTGRRLNANRLLEAAKRLAVSAETYSTIVQGKTRNEKILVNIPEVEITE